MTSTLFLLRFLVLELTIHMYILTQVSGRILKYVPTGHINFQREVRRQNIDLCNKQKG